MIPASALATIAVLGLTPEQAAGIADAMSEVERATIEHVSAPLLQKLGVKRAYDREAKRRDRAGLMKRLAAVETATGVAAVVPIRPG